MLLQKKNNWCWETTCNTASHTEYPKHFHFCDSVITLKRVWLNWEKQFYIKDPINQKEHTSTFPAFVQKN